MPIFCPDNISITDTTMRDPQRNIVMSHSPTVETVWGEYSRRIFCRPGTAVATLGLGFGSHVSQLNCLGRGSGEAGRGGRRDQEPADARGASLSFPVPVSKTESGGGRGVIREIS